MEDYNKYIISANIDKVVLKLSDIVFENEISLDSSVIKNIAIDILDLVDDNGNKIFKLDKNYHFDSQSLEIFNKARQKFEEECELCSDIISEENITNIKYALKLLEETLKNKEIIKSDKKVKFITIPTPDGKSILDNDVNGNSVLVSFGKNKHQAAAPHHNVFKLSQSSTINGKSNAALILSELERTEVVLADDPCIIKHTGTGQSFQSEEGMQVRKNSAAALRIPISQYGEDVIAIVGIFHKVGQKDPVVQSEYNVRKNILSSMKNDLNLNIQDCEKAYYNFKLQLIKALYGSKIDAISAVYRYMVDVVMEDSKIIERGI